MAKTGIAIAVITALSVGVLKVGCIMLKTIIYIYLSTHYSKHYLVQIYTLGEQAVVLQLGSGVIMEVHERVMAYTRAIQTANFPWVIELVPAYNSVTVYYSIPTILQIAKTDDLAAWVTDNLLGISVDFSNNKQANKKIIEIPACYDPALGVDMLFVSEELKLGIDKIIEIHSNRLYTVYMLGFLPGFPYMGSVDERIQHPRKKIPRNKYLRAVLVLQEPKQVFIRFNHRVDGKSLQGPPLPYLIWRRKILAYWLQAIRFGLFLYRWKDFMK